MHRQSNASDNSNVLKQPRLSEVSNQSIDLRGQGQETHLIQIISNFTKNKQKESSPMSSSSQVQVSKNSQFNKKKLKRNNSILESNDEKQKFNNTDEQQPVMASSHREVFSNDDLNNIQNQNQEQSQKDKTDSWYNQQIDSQNSLSAQAIAKNNQQILIQQSNNNKSKNVLKEKDVKQIPQKKKRNSHTITISQDQSDNFSFAPQVQKKQINKFLLDSKQASKPDESKSQSIQDHLKISQPSQSIHSSYQQKFLNSYVSNGNTQTSRKNINLNLTKETGYFKSNDSLDSNSPIQQQDSIIIKSQQNSEDDTESPLKIGSQILQKIDNQVQIPKKQQQQIEEYREKKRFSVYSEKCMEQEENIRKNSSHVLQMSQKSQKSQKQRKQSIKERIQIMNETSIQGKNAQQKLQKQKSINNHISEQELSSSSFNSPDKNKSIKNNLVENNFNTVEKQPEVNENQQQIQPQNIPQPIQIHSIQQQQIQQLKNQYQQKMLLQQQQEDQEQQKQIQQKQQLLSQQRSAILSPTRKPTLTVPNTLLPPSQLTRPNRNNSGKWDIQSARRISISDSDQSRMFLSNHSFMQKSLAPSSFMNSSRRNSRTSNCSIFGQDYQNNYQGGVQFANTLHTRRQSQIESADHLSNQQNQNQKNIMGQSMALPMIKVKQPVQNKNINMSQSSVAKIKRRISYRHPQFPMPPQAQNSMKSPMIEQNIKLIQLQYAGKNGLANSSRKPSIQSNTTQQTVSTIFMNNLNVQSMQNPENYKTNLIDAVQKKINYIQQKKLLNKQSQMSIMSPKENLYPIREKSRRRSSRQSMFRAESVNNVQITENHIQLVKQNPKLNLIDYVENLKKEKLNQEIQQGQEEEFNQTQNNHYQLDNHLNSLSPINSAVKSNNIHYYQNDNNLLPYGINDDQEYDFNENYEDDDSSIENSSSYNNFNSYRRPSNISNRSQMLRSYIEDVGDININNVSKYDFKFDDMVDLNESRRIISYNNSERNSKRSSKRSSEGNIYQSSNNNSQNNRDNIQQIQENQENVQNIRAQQQSLSSNNMLLQQQQNNMLSSLQIPGQSYSMKATDSVNSMQTLGESNKTLSYIHSSNEQKGVSPFKDNKTQNQYQTLQHQNSANNNMMTSMSDSESFKNFFTRSSNLQQSDNANEISLQELMLQRRASKKKSTLLQNIPEQDEIGHSQFNSNQFSSNLSNSNNYDETQQQINFVQQQSKYYQNNNFQDMPSPISISSPVKRGYYQHQNSSPFNNQGNYNLDDSSPILGSMYSLKQNGLLMNPKPQQSQEMSQIHEENYSKDSIKSISPKNNDSKQDNIKNNKINLDSNNNDQQTHSSPIHNNGLSSPTNHFMNSTKIILTGVDNNSINLVNQDSEQKPDKQNNITSTTSPKSHNQNSNLGKIQLVESVQLSSIREVNSNNTSSTHQNQNSKLPLSNQSNYTPKHEKSEFYKQSQKQKNNSGQNNQISNSTTNNDLLANVTMATSEAYQFSKKNADTNDKQNSNQDLNQIIQKFPKVPVTIKDFTEKINKDEDENNSSNIFNETHYKRLLEIKKELIDLQNDDDLQEIEKEQLDQEKQKLQDEYDQLRMLRQKAISSGKLQNELYAETPRVKSASAGFMQNKQSTQPVVIDADEINKKENQLHVKPDTNLDKISEAEEDNTLQNQLEKSIIQSMRDVTQLKESMNATSSEAQRQQVIKKNKTINYSLMQMNHSIVQTDRIDRSVDESGQKRINKYVILNYLGKGQFGKVKLIIDTKTNIRYAIKIINKQKLKKKLLSRKVSAFSMIEREIAIMKKLAHPNICHLHEVIDDPNEKKLYLIMDFIKKGAICSKLYWQNEPDIPKTFQDKNILPVDKLRKYIIDCLKGLDYLHNYADVVHRDIKPDNLLIDNDDELKIADFGISKIVEGKDDKLTTDAGTKYFLAPEMWESDDFRGYPTDIWAVGVTFYQLAVGKPPFDGKTLSELKHSILKHEPHFPPDTDPDLKAFLLKCLRKNPVDRSSVEQLMNEDFVTCRGKNKLIEENFKHSLNINEEELNLAFTKLSVKGRVKVQAQLKKNNLNVPQGRKSTRTQTLNVDYQYKPTSNTLTPKNSQFKPQ